MSNIEKRIHELYCESYRNNGEPPVYLILGFDSYLELNQSLISKPHIDFCNCEITRYENMAIVISKNKGQLEIGYKTVRNYEIQDEMVKGIQDKPERIKE